MCVVEYRYNLGCERCPTVRDRLKLLKNMHTNHFNSREGCAKPMPIHLVVPPKLLMAAKPILGTCPCIWYLTPSDNSVILCASDHYHEREHGTWEEHPPMPIEGGLLVH